MAPQPPQYDVLIIGGGVTGLMILAFLNIFFRIFRFQHGNRFEASCTPLATDIGAVQFVFSFVLIQISTSLCLSCVPPNHAAINPRGVSAIVDA